MYLFDKKFKKNFHFYIMQSILATLSLVIIFYLLNTFTHTAVVASLGATTFIIFAMPNYPTAQPRKVIGGHLIGIIVGIFCLYLSSLNLITETSFISKDMIEVIIPALSVGLSIFIMVITNTEHPPAAGTALGITVQGWNYSTVLIILITVIALSIIKYLLKSWLKDLV